MMRRKPADAEMIEPRKTEDSHHIYTSSRPGIRSFVPHDYPPCLPYNVPDSSQGTSLK